MANPILNENYAAQERVLQGEPMTVNGTIQITAFLDCYLLLQLHFAGQDLLWDILIWV